MASKHVIDSSPLECCLCFQIMTEPKQLKCTHTFCKDCLINYSESTRERNQIPCPLCREVTPLKIGDVSETSIKALRNNIKSLQIEINAALHSFRRETQKIVDVELTKVDPCVDKIIMKINRAYDDQIQQYNEKRGKHIKECNTIRDQIKRELHKIRDERELKLGCITSAKDLVENGLDTRIEGHARSVHDYVCGRLHEDLASVKGHGGKDLKRAKEVVSRAECLTFTQYRINAEHSLGELNHNQWRLEKMNIELALGGSAYNLTATHDGKMIVGHWFGGDGVDVCSVNGVYERRLQGKCVRSVSVLRDGRYVIRDWDGHISLYTQTWKKCNAVLFQRVDAYGGMDVDGCDHIYVGCENADVVRVFTPVGGSQVREIPCHYYEPSIVCTMNHSEMLLLSDRSSVRVVDGEGNVMYNVSNERSRARVAVLRDDNILIGWTKAGRRSVDLYTNQLRLVRRVLADYPVNGSVCAIREFSTGEIAICDEHKLHIFRKTSVPLTGETSQ